MQRHWGWRRCSSSGPRRDVGRGLASRHYLKGGRDSGESQPDNNTSRSQSSEVTNNQRSKQRHMAEIRRQLEEDPFTALFGRRIEPIGEQGMWPLSNLRKVLDWVTTPSRHLLVQNEKHPEDEAATFRSSNNTTRGDLNTDLASKRQKSTISIEEDFYIDPITLCKVTQSPTARKQEVINIPVKTFDAHRAQNEENSVTHTTSTRNATAVDRALAGHDSRSSSSIQKNLRLDEAESPRIQSASQDSVAAGLSEYDRTNSYSTPDVSPTGDEDWLVTEGFAAEKPRAERKTTSPAVSEQSRSPTAALASTIPSQASTDISSESKDTPAEPCSKLSATSDGHRPRLVYDERESQEEDLDLLRSSDVRAKSGLINNPPRETDMERQEERRRLEEDYCKTSRPDGDHPDEIAALQHVQSRRHDQQQSRDKPSSHSPRDCDGESRIQYEESAYAAECQAQNGGASSAIDGPEALHQPSTSHFAQGADYAEKQNTRRQREKALVQEIRSIYEDSYGTLDSKHRQQRGKVTSSQGSPSSAVDEALGLHDEMAGPEAYQFTTGQDGLERELGQTKNAPHFRSSSAEGFSGRTRQRDEEQALFWEQKEQILQEELVEGAACLYDVEAELQRISERLRHLHGTSSQSTTTAMSPEEASIYKILAYDPSADKITTAMTTSAVSTLSPTGSEDSLAPPEVLLRLNKPAKFLGYFASLEAEGYEIASGGGDVMVFRKVRDAEPAAFDPVEIQATPTELSNLPRRYSLMNPVDGTTTGNFASPTGFVNYDTVLSPSVSEEGSTSAGESERDPTPSSVKIKKEEEVFSGQQKWSDESPPPKRPRRIRKAARRAFFVGLWVAGCSYAFGVVAEFFRTGGSSGMGPQGF